MDSNVPSQTVNMSPQSGACNWPRVAVGRAEPIEIRSRTNLDEIMQLAEGDLQQELALSLRGVHRLPAAVQQAFFRFMSVKRDSLRIQKTDGHSTTDPFEALGATPQSEMPNDHLIRAAIELASAWNVDAGSEEDAAMQVRSVFGRRDIRCPRDLASSIKCATFRHRRATSEQPTIASLIRQAGGDSDRLEIDNDLVLPPGWSCDQQHDCFVREYGPMKGESAVTLDGILFVSQISIDPVTGAQQVEVCWFRHGRLQRTFFDRKQVFSRSAEAFSSFGWPVNSINWKLWVAFFTDFMRTNEFRLNTTKKAMHFGWQTIDGKKAFAIGDTIVVPCDGGSERRRLGADDELKQIAAPYCHCGDRSESLRLLQEVAQLPVVWFTILCSFASVLLEPLRLRSFILDLCGETSSGKTIAMILGASMWGRPDPQSEDDVDSSVKSSVSFTWNVTRVWVERTASRLRSLTLFLDDSKQVAVPKNVSDICYDLANCQNRGRGTINGVADQAFWRLVMISTGEQSLTSFCEHAGVRARIIELRGSPFPSRNVEWRRRVEEWSDIARRNFGFLGAEFVQFVVEHQADWSRWRSRISELKSELECDFSQNAIAGRHLEYLATITLTAELVCELFGLPYELKRPVDGVRQSLIGEYEEADRPKEALEQLLDHIAKDQSIVTPLNGPFVTPLPYEKSRAIAKWTQQGDDMQLCRSSLAIFQSDFESLMKAFGFVPDEILTAWKQRRWLHHDQRRKTKAVRCGGPQPIRTVCVTAEAVAQIHCERNLQVGSSADNCSQSLPMVSEGGNDASQSPTVG